MATWHNRLVTYDLEFDKLTLIDLDNGTQRNIDLPEGVLLVDGYGGAFSPDGRLVAVPGFNTRDRSAPDARSIVVLIDFETGSAITVQGMFGDTYYGMAGS